MKTKLTIVISIFYVLFFSGNIKAQSPCTVTLVPIGGSPPEPVVCNNNPNINNYMMTVTVQQDCEFYINMSTPCPLNATCDKHPFEITGIPGLSYDAMNDRFKVPANMGVNVFIFNLYIDCSLLECATADNPTAQVGMKFSSNTCGCNPQIFDVNGTGSNVHTFTVQLFSIIAPNPNNSYLVQYGDHLTLDFVYFNPTQTIADVAIRFAFGPFDCNRFVVEQVAGYDYMLEFSGPSGPNYLGGYFGQYLPLAATDVGLYSLQTLTIHVNIYITGCINGCDPDYFTADLDYLCSNYYLNNDIDYCAQQEACPRTVPQTFTLPDDFPNTGELSVERLWPQNLWQAEAEQCFGDNLIWMYKITNTGSTVIHDATFVLRDEANGLSFAKVCTTGAMNPTLSIVSGCPNCGTPQYTYTMSSTPEANACTPCGTGVDNVQVCTVTLQGINPGEGIEPGAVLVFSFGTNLCCNTDEALLNNAKFINQWTFSVGAADECGLGTIDVVPVDNTVPTLVSDQHPWHGFAMTPNNVIASRGVSYYFDDNAYSASADLNQYLPFIPTAFNIYGNPPSQVPVSVPMDHFTPAGTGDSDFNLFFHTYPYSGSPMPSGILKVVIEMDVGLNLVDYGNPTNAIRINHSNGDPNFVLHPMLCMAYDQDIGSSIYPCADQPGYHAKSYEYYFDLGDPIQIPWLASYYTQTPLFILNQFFQHGVVKFTMEGSCDACQPMAGYRVKTYLAPKRWSSSVCGQQQCSGGMLVSTGDPLCWIPLAKTSWPMFVHCAGCMTPGIILTNDVIRRTTFGFEDLNNDGVITNADGPILPSYPPLQQGLVNDQRSFRGDLIESVMDAYLYPGEPMPSGWLYSDMLSNGAELTHLYLEKSFPLSDNITGFDVQWYELDFTATDQTTGDVWSIITYTNPHPNVYYDINANKFYVKIPKSVLVCGTCPPFKFDVEQDYKLTMRYKVCGNQLPIDNMITDYVSVVTDRMYLVRDDYDLQSLTDRQLLTALAEADNSNVPPLPNWITYAENHQFICEAGGGGHTFYALQYINHLGDYFNNSCDPLSTPWVASTIAGGAEMSFKYEFRPPPISLVDYSITVPYGFNVLGQPTTSAVYRKYDQFEDLCTACCLPPLSNCNPITCPLGYTPPPLSTFSFNTDIPITFPYYSPETQITPPQCELPFGEEVFREDYNIRYQPNCDNDPVPVGYVNYVATFKYTDCDNVDHVIVEPLQNGIDDDIPDPLLTLNFLPSPALVGVNTHDVCWRFTITNSPASPDAANNLFVYIDPNLTLPYLNSWTLAYDTDCDGDADASVPYVNGVYQLTSSLTPGNQLCFLLCAEMIMCQPLCDDPDIPDPPDCVFPITVNWGWDCEGFPTSSTYQQTCFNDEYIISISRAPFNVNAYDYKVYDNSFNSTTTYNLCEQFIVEGRFISDQPGTVTLNDVLSLTVSGLASSTQVVQGELHNPDNGASLLFSLSPSGPDYVATFQIIVDLYNQLGYGVGDPNPSAHGFLHSGDKIWVRIWLMEICNTDEIDLPDITLHFRSFCGDDFDKTAQPNSSTPTPLQFAGANYCKEPCDPCATSSFNFTILSDDCHEITFINQSTSCPPPLTISYEWQFGDNTPPFTTTDPTPFTYTYTTAGVYHVCLLVMCNDGETDICENMFCMDIIVCECSAQVAAFTWAAICTTVQFTNQSGYCDDGSPPAFTWDFGDYTYSSATSPSHNYSSSATLPVCLAAYCAYNDCVSRICQDVTVVSCRQGVNSGANYDANFTVLVVPNPVSENKFDLVIQSDFEGEARINIFNSIGEKIIRSEIYLRKGYNSRTFILEDAGAGIYMLNITGDNRQKSMKFSVIR